MLRKILRRILFTILGFIAFLALYAMFAFLLPLIKVNRDFTETPNGVVIYLRSNGVHTDVCLPVNTPYIDWRTVFPPAGFKAVDSTFQYVDIGWGNKGFYLNTPTWADLTFKTAFKALFCLDSAAVHIAYDKYPPVVSPAYCHQITISADQYRNLIAYINSTINFHSGKAAVFPGKGYDTTDNFYEATGHYSFVKTCNVWTTGALKAAGIRQGLWSPFQGGVMNGYDNAANK